VIPLTSLSLAYFVTQFRFIGSKITVVDFQHYANYSVVRWRGNIRGNHGRLRKSCLFLSRVCHKGERRSLDVYKMASSNLHMNAPTTEFSLCSSFMLTCSHGTGGLSDLSIIHPSAHLWNQRVFQQTASLNSVADFADFSALLSVRVYAWRTSIYLE
jgi:hypothetical protein